MFFTLFSVLTRIPVGILSDVFRKSYVTAFSVALQGVGMFLFWLINGSSPFWLILVFAIVYGLGLSGINPVRAPILTEYFGTKNFGIIYGLLSIFFTLASVVIQPLAGWVFDTYHDYKPVWMALTGFAALALVVILTIPVAKPPRNQLGIDIQGEVVTKPE
jgi:MFS family permease